MAKTSTFTFSCLYNNGNSITQLLNDPTDAIVTAALAIGGAGGEATASTTGINLLATINYTGTTAAVYVKNNSTTTNILLAASHAGGSVNLTIGPGKAAYLPDVYTAVTITTSTGTAPIAYAVVG